MTAIRRVLGTSILACVLWSRGVSQTVSDTTRLQAVASTTTETILTDMSKCTPAASLSSTLEKGKWKLIGYETRELSGTLAYAAQEADAPEIRLALGVQGRYHVFVACAHLGDMAPYPLAKLDNAEAFTPLRRQVGDLEEVYLTTADIHRGQELVIAQRSKGAQAGACVAWVRLIPADGASDAFTGKPLRHKGIAGTIDGYTFFYERGSSTESEVLEDIEYLKNTDVDTLIIQAGGSSTMNYVSRVTSDSLLAPRDLYPRPGDRIAMTAIRELMQKGINPTKLLVTRAKGAGLRALSGIRTGAWEYREPFSDTMTCSFYRQHPEWRITAGNGAQIAGMSYAVPQVRAHLVDMMQEMAEQGSDGVCVLFHRGPPYTGFEGAFVDHFKAQYGISPIGLPRSDKRLRLARADCVTSLMRETRSMLDRVGKSRGQRLLLTAITLRSEEDNLDNGIDIPLLMRERLIDIVYPDCFGGDAGKAAYIESLSKTGRPLGIDVCPLNQGWNWTRPSEQQLVKDAAQLYESGAAGLLFWDLDLSTNSHVRNVAMRLGDRETVNTWLKTNPPRPRTFKFTRLGDYREDLGVYQGSGF